MSRTSSLVLQLTTMSLWSVMLKLIRKSAPNSNSINGLYIFLMMINDFSILRTCFFSIFHTDEAFTFGWKTKVSLYKIFLKLYIVYILYILYLIQSIILQPQSFLLLYLYEIVILNAESSSPQFLHEMLSNWNLQKKSALTTEQAITEFALQQQQ